MKSQSSRKYGPYLLHVYFVLTWLSPFNSNTVIALTYIQFKGSWSHSSDDKNKQCFSFLHHQQYRQHYFYSQWNCTYAHRVALCLWLSRGGQVRVGFQMTLRRESGIDNVSRNQCYCWPAVLVNHSYLTYLQQTHNSLISSGKANQADRSFYWETLPWNLS